MSWDDPKVNYANGDRLPSRIPDTEGSLARESGWSSPGVHPVGTGSSQAPRLAMRGLGFLCGRYPFQAAGVPLGEHRLPR